MIHFVKNTLAFIFAIAIAAITTFLIILLGHYFVPIPDGIDTNDFESIKSNFHLYELKHFLFPLLAHAIGTFLASYTVSRFALSHKLWFVIGIGILFTLLSLSLSIRIGHFNWIGILEIVQYIPFSLLGYKFWKWTSKKDQ